MKIIRDENVCGHFLKMLKTAFVSSNEARHFGLGRDEDLGLGERR